MSGKQNLPVWAQAPYETVLNALARLVAQTGITPNALTLISLVPAIAAGVLAAGEHFVWAAVLMLTSGLCDILDGALARQTGKASRFGALLDSSLDRLSDAAVPLGLVLVYAPHGFGRHGAGAGGPVGLYDLLCPGAGRGPAFRAAPPVAQARGPHGHHGSGAGSGPRSGCRA